MPNCSMFRVSIAVISFFALLIVAVPTARAHAPSGAIFTTLADGSEVNYNIYPNKEAVYLDGGPGPGAPQTAAGLDDGTYVFQVTDPSGKTLLSTDAAICRQFTVAGGVNPRRGYRLRTRNRNRCRPQRRDGSVDAVQRHAQSRRRVQGVGDAR
jgi:hypothetical protein